MFSVGFLKESAGFPAFISFTGKSEELVKNSGPCISAFLGNEKITPFLEENNPDIIRSEEKCDVVFNNIHWKYSDGRRVKGYRLAIAYEIYNDGAAFSKTLFFAETLEKQSLKDFNFSIKARFADDNEANWVYWKYPASADASIIQSSCS